jgi:HEAT repeat protein
MTSEKDRILGELGSADEEIRRLAVERLSELPAREAVPRLVESLGDASWRVRKAAVERLVDSRDSDRVADALIEALADGENPGRRNSAVEALMACGAPVVPRLVEALAADDNDVRKLLVDTLAGIGDASSRPHLIASLRDPDPNVRAAAADGLGVLAGDEAASALRSVATRADEDRLVRFSALRALARFECAIPSDELLAVASDPVLRPAAFALLGYSEDAGAEDQLLKGLGMASRANREAAVEALLSRLARLDGAAADALASRVREVALATEGLLEGAVLRLSEADLSVRLTWVQFLGLVGSPACVLPILESAKDEAIAEVAQSTLEALGEVAEEALTAAWPRMDRALRRRACALLAHTPGALANGRLREALDDLDADLRTAAARALGARRAGDALPNLLRRLEAAALDEEPESEEEVEALVEALVSLASSDGLASQVVAGLSFHLASGVEPIRRAAAGVLTRVARPEDAEALCALLRDPSAAVRRLAVAGLGRLDPAVAAEPLRLALADESPLVRAVAAATLGASPAESAFEDLQRLLADEDPRVAAAAVRAIGAYCARAPAGRAAERARALVRLSEAVREGAGAVAMAAIEALEAMGGADAAAVAVSALERDEPELLQAAVGCVGRHADADGLLALIPAVQSPSWAVRGEVIQTLADRRVAMALPAILRRLEIERDSFVRDVIVRALRRLEE